MSARARVCSQFQSCSSKHVPILLLTCTGCQGIEWSWHQWRPSLFPAMWKQDATASLVVITSSSSRLFQVNKVSWFSVCCNGVGLSQESRCWCRFDDPLLHLSTFPSFETSRRRIPYLYNAPVLSHAVCHGCLTSLGCTVSTFGRGRMWWPGIFPWLEKDVGNILKSFALRVLNA